MFTFVCIRVYMYVCMYEYVLTRMCLCVYDKLLCAGTNVHEF